MTAQVGIGLALSFGLGFALMTAAIPAYSKPQGFPQLRPAKELTSAGKGIPRPVLRRESPNLILSDEDATLYRSAFAAVNARDFASAQSIARVTANPVLRDVIDWAIAVSPGNRGDSSAAIARYRQFRDWPKANTLAWRVEQSLARDIPRDPALIRAWFSIRQPVSAAGMWAYADYLRSIGDRRAATDWIRKAWRTGKLEAADESMILRVHGHKLTYDDHTARLDRALWEDRFAAARRQLKRVSGSQRALGRARLALKTQSRQVDFRIAAVPAHLKNDPGLAYDRIRWRRRKGNYQGALDLLIDNPFQYSRAAAAPDAKYDYTAKLWKERRLLARWALRKGKADQAYRLVVHHGLTTGVDYAEAEWLAGFIALHYLGQPAIAYGHFSQLAQTVSKPISLSRAHYWSAKAARRAPDISSKIVFDHYRQAAIHNDYYYGRLAADQLTDDGGFQPPSPGPKPKASNPKFGVILQALKDAGQDKMLRQFYAHMISDAADQDAQPADVTASVLGLSNLARHLQRPDLGLMLAKSQVGNEATAPYLTDDLWPEVHITGTTEVLLWPAPAPALVHGVIRQESAFIPQVKSRVGARGYMQLMPATAVATAKLHGLGYSKSALTGAPHYNITLGTAYLAEMLDRFDGATILAAAAYNAGPHRVDRWLKDYGDPRTGEIDPVNWVEHIPYSETRNYVQRVMENFTVYARRFGTRQANVPIRRLMLNHRARQ